jgi:hypothetical protein
MHIAAPHVVGRHQNQRGDPSQRTHTTRIQEEINIGRAEASSPVHSTHFVLDSPNVTLLRVPYLLDHLWGHEVRCASHRLPHIMQVHTRGDTRSSHGAPHVQHRCTVKAKQGTVKAKRGTGGARMLWVGVSKELRLELGNVVTGEGE